MENNSLHGMLFGILALAATSVVLPSGSKASERAEASWQTHQVLDVDLNRSTLVTGTTTGNGGLHDTSDIAV